MMIAEKIDLLFETIDQMKALVIGDVMIDAYLWGKVDRISPEAPVPVVSMTERESRLGGAANVALNVMAMGATPIICSVIGDDDRRPEFDQLLDKRGFSKDGIIYASGRSTTVKTRVISQGQHLLRVDEEDTSALAHDIAQKLIEKVERLINEQKPKVIIFEDYNKGVLTPEVIAGVIAAARAANIPVTVDPKKEHFFEYIGVDLFKPNLKELREGLKLELRSGDLGQIEEALDLLKERLHNKLSFVTLSDHGVAMKADKELYHTPAHPREILDVSGAGDTVISVASLCLAAGWSPEHIAALSNLAGGQVCEKVGVVPVDKEQLRKEALKLKE